jgi:rhodanese-related sulfurtransferase
MSFIENNWMLILVMVLSGAMLIWPMVQRRLSPMKEIGTLNATHLINHQNAVLLDVRENNELQGGKLPNAVHIPLSELKARGAELAKLTKRPIVVYCARGQRARAAGAALEKQGFADIYQLNGGYRAWKDAGLPVSQVP